LEQSLKESLGFNLTYHQLNGLQTFDSFTGTHVPRKWHVLLSWTGGLIGPDTLRLTSLQVFKNPVPILPKREDSSSA